MYYLFYDEKDTVIGWLESNSACLAQNAKSVSKEEYISNGGILKIPNNKEEISNNPELEMLLDAVIQ